MLIGVAIKNYKIYNNIQYIPISSGQRFSSYLGANGTGKTSIFEALDRFFNGGEWSINNENKIKSKDSFVAPLFCIAKNKINLNTTDTLIASAISEYFWGYNQSQYDTFITQIQNSISTLASSGIDRSTHYLMMLGTDLNGELHIPHFEKDILSALPESNKDEILLLTKKVKSHYRYIYLPAEADSMDFTKMESIYVQQLLDEDIKKTIRNAIPATSVTEINKTLKKFIDQINNNLVDYTYKGTYKDKLTINDLIDRIFAAYFGIKVLHKTSNQSEISIKNLSSGEKKRALIDLSYALISGSEKRAYQIVLAIDEPDTSIHVAACHDQFEKIASIPHLCNPNPQVLINTHWYGFIPIIRSGIAHSLSRNNNSIDIFSFNLENFREHINQSIKSSKGQSPKEVELKSYQDMIQSVVVSMLREDPYNWIFCEGLSDKIYLDHYLEPLLKSNNLRIVPLGGFKQVRRVYNYLVAPLSDRDAGFKSQAICLVDTDAQREDVEPAKGTKNLFFKRLVRDEPQQKIFAVNIDDQRNFPTEIEFTLREEILNSIIKSADSGKSLKNFATLKRIISETELVEKSDNLYDYLNLSPKHKKDLMDNFFDIEHNKVNFARLYVTHDPDRKHPPNWMTSIKELIAK